MQGRSAVPPLEMLSSEKQVADDQSGLPRMLNNKHFQNILFCGYPAGSAFTALSGRSLILTNEGREVHSQHSDIPSKHFPSQTAELGNSMCSPQFLCILSQFGSPFG